MLRVKRLYLNTIEKGWDNKSILLFARDGDGKRFRFICTNFRPYFYVTADSPIPEKPEITLVEDVPFEIKHTLFQEPLKKLFVNKTSSVPNVKNWYHEQGIRTYEADILYPLRFKIDLKILEGFTIPLSILKRERLTASGRKYIRQKGKWWVKDFIPVRKEEIEGF